MPFPFEEREYPQPVTQPLKFSQETKIYWTDSITHVKPIIKKFDIKRLPLKVFDSSAFLPFLKKPEEVSFDGRKLRDTAFNYDSLPSNPLKCDVSVLEPPQLLKSLHPHIKNGASDILFEYGEPFIGNTNACVLEDNRGLVWIASDNKLYRYDGEHLLMYTLGSVNKIYNMLEDNEGKIWLGAENLTGLTILDLKSGTQSNIRIYEESRGYNTGGMMLDDQQRVWVTTDDHDLKDGNPIYIIDKNRQNIKQLSKKQGIANGNSVIQDKTGNIYISTFGEGLNIINLKDKKISFLQRKDGLSSDTLGVVQKDNMNKVLVASFNGGELNIVDMQHRTIKIYDKRQGFILKDNIHIGNLVEDNSGNIWMGTWGKGEEEGTGLEVINPERLLFKNISTINGLSGNQIGGLLQDKDGQIWVSTYKGLNTIRENDNNPKHTGYDNITTLAEDSRGNIWVGIVNSGIKILDTITGLARSFNESNGLSSKDIQNMNFYKGKIYIESYGGLDIIDSTFKTIEHIGKRQGLTNDSIANAFLDKEGRIWISGSGTIGLSVIDRRKEKIFHFGIAQGLEDSTLSKITQDNVGRIWFSNPANRIGVIDLKKNTVKYLENITGLKMPGDKVIAEDMLGNIWIGTQNGIYIVNAADDSIISISEREGLVGNSVISLNEYGHCMYVGTKDGGINILSPPTFSFDKKWEIESFGNSQGIYKRVATLRSDIITQDGRFLWGDKGITTLRKAILHNDVPKTYICEIDLLNKPISFTNRSWPDKNTDTIWSSKRDTFYLKNNKSENNFYQEQQNIKWDSIGGPYNMPVNLTFPYDDNYLQFHFTQANLGSQDTTWYSYILNGVDKRWSDRTDKSFSQNYLNLSPGNYKFRVSSLSNGKWCEPVIFSFTIKTPWWQSMWFYAFCLLALILTFHLFYRFRINQILKVQAVRNRIAADLHDDIGSTLSSISIMTELAKVKSSDSLSLLNSIGESASAIQENMSDLVWVVNPKNDRFNNMVQRMKQFASEILNAKSIAFHLIVDKDVYDERLSMDQRKKVYLFFKEAINNAAKYSCADRVNVHISSGVDQIILMIEDNGNGFNLNNGHSGNGLANLQRRADELKGLFNIRSAINEGTKIQLSFKIT